MRKAWMSAALFPALLLLAGPLSAQQRAPTTGTHGRLWRRGRAAVDEDDQRLAQSNVLTA